MGLLRSCGIVPLRSGSLWFVNGMEGTIEGVELTPLLAVCDELDYDQTEYDICEYDVACSQLIPTNARGEHEDIGRRGDGKEQDL